MLISKVQLKWKLENKWLGVVSILPDCQQGAPEAQHLQQQSWFYTLNLHLAAVSLDPVLEKHPEYCMYSTLQGV